MLRRTITASCGRGPPSGRAGLSSASRPLYLSLAARQSTVPRPPPPTASHSLGIRHLNVQANERSQSTAAEGPAGYYASLIKSGSLRPDPQQEATVALLHTLYENVMAYDPPPLQEPEIDPDATRPLHEHKGRDDIESPDFAWRRGPDGLYLYGSVGTGKTMVMDLFYNSTNIDRKRRVHFHAFMQDVHRRIHQLRIDKGVTYDPLPIIATELTNEAWLLCFDELQVTDITDAMILRRLFDELFKRGMVMITTSNRHPDELYQNGIQRASFLPTIALLKERCRVHSLNSGIDYRKEAKHSVSYSDSPLNNATKHHVDAIFKKLTEGQKVEPRSLGFLGRTLEIAETADGIARMTFQQICGEPHSAADYLEVVNNFHTIILTDIPRMTLSHRNEARRFITFIDTMYENKTRLLISAETDLANLFTGDDDGQGSGYGAGERLLMDDLKLTTEHLTSSIFTGSEEVFAFQRAISRLVEMQSLQWLGPELKDVLSSRVL
ncbi:AFG1-like ATPase-domain-containing protein [Geranomyces variabilis]|nr:AFG1-like ATPase-domain-containing protein [Geranomyces variabilis]